MRSTGRNITISRSADQTPTLLELERQRQHTRFVGRAHELALWRSALAGNSVNILYIYGPAGVGKTCLLQAFAAEAQRCLIATTYIDARELKPRLPSVLAVLDEAQLSDPGDGTENTQRVLLLDTYEHLEAIEPLVRHELLRRVRSATLLVIAGRTAPSAEWRALSLWGSAIVPVALRNLGPADARTYLALSGIHGKTASAIIAFSHGNPLALALAANAWQHKPQAPFAPENAPDVIAALYEYFLRAISDPHQRAALESSAILHTTSEAVLGALLDGEPASAFAWLRGLSFMKIGRRGVFPHDLAREVILADLRWRNPARLALLAQRAQRYFLTLMSSCSGEELTQASSEFTFVLGHNPQLQRLLMAFPDHELVLDDLRPGDEPLLSAAVLRFEGPMSMQYLHYWLSRRPSEFRIVRGPSGAPLAFMANLRLDLMTVDERAGDPLVRAAWDYALMLFDGRPEGIMNMWRFWMDCEVHQQPSPASALCTQMASAQCFQPGHTLAFARMRERFSRHWEGLIRLVGAELVPGGQYQIDGEINKVIMIDNRSNLIANMLAAAITPHPTPPGTQPPPPRSDAPVLAVLSEEDFSMQVRTALRVLHDPGLLANSPLIYAQAVAARVASAAQPRERAAALRALFLEAAESLRDAVRGDTWYRVLDAAYLNPVGKHEAAAAVLGMSYSTFRRTLATAIKRLVEVLWQRELPSR